MQVVRDFCEHSNAICTGCRFPELVRGWATMGKISRQECEGGEG
jgi:hypothetical protein